MSVKAREVVSIFAQAYYVCDILGQWAESRGLRRRGRVTAVECDPANFEVLAKNMCALAFGVQPWHAWSPHRPSED